jgi:hypothetical protein
LWIPPPGAPLDAGGQQEGLRNAHDRRVRHRRYIHRTWVLLTEATPGGWGLGGHANTNDELVAAARKQIAELQGKAGSSQDG